MDEENSKKEKIVSFVNDDTPDCPFYCMDCSQIFGFEFNGKTKCLCLKGIELNPTFKYPCEVE